MTPAEALEVLIVARVLDARLGEPDDVKARLWATALEGLPVKGVMRAVQEHYAASSEAINPGHIRPLMKKIMAEWRRQQRRAEQEQIWAARRRVIESGEIEHNPRRVELTDQEKSALAQRIAEERAARSPAAAEALEILRSRVPASKPGALANPDAIRYRGEPARGHEPTPITHLLDAVRRNLGQRTRRQGGET